MSEDSLGVGQAYLLQRLLREERLDMQGIVALFADFRRTPDRPFLEVLRTRVDVPESWLEEARRRDALDGGRTEILADAGAIQDALPEHLRVLRRPEPSTNEVLARDERTGLPGHVRWFRPAPADLGPAIERFERTVDALAGIDSPGIPRILDHGHHDGTLYVIRPVIEGTSFAALTTEAADRQTLLSTLAEVAGIVGALHEAGLTHGDLTARRVQVATRHGVMVLDPVPWTHPGRADRTSHSPFWAPEVYQPDPEVLGPSADVFGLGVLLYLALTGRVPYEGATRQAMIESFLETRLVAPRDHDAEIERDLEAICSRALELDPALRHPGAGQFSEELHRYIVGGRKARGRDESGPLVRGDRIGSYTILRRIGEGGMGVIYLARHLGLDREVAVKVLRLADSRERQRFLREARLLAGMRHANIVEIHDVGEDGSRSFLVMEYLEGGTLAERLEEKGTFDWPEAVELLLPIARALAEAHDRGIVHRDIKPENILLSSDGVPKLSDFGLAWQTGSFSLTSTGIILGTPYYLSPEGAQGRRELTAASDVFSFGAVLYTCLTGVLPHPGSSIAEVISSILTREPLGLRQLRPEIPASLEAICWRCLRTDRALRYDDAGALVADLEKVEPEAASRRQLVVAIVLACLALLALALAFAR